MEYNNAAIESKWKAFWAENKVYKVDIDTGKPKYYILDMFPYPSGSGLHVGHPLGYIASDIFSRYKRMSGFNVLHPMGYDSFGLPAEQYAVQTGVHPSESTADNIKKYRSQLDNIGFSYDWDREVQTSSPDFYKWTQWIFIKLFSYAYDTKLEKAVPITGVIKHFEVNGSKGLTIANSQETAFTAADWKAFSPKEKDEVLMNYRLAYRKTTFVNWCEALGTVLANDEVKEGVSERGGHPVNKRPMIQWSLRITAYAKRLLEDLEELDWSASMKKMQSNWIGRSIGAQLFFNVQDADESIEIFTTRADTIFGATYLVLAPEHELAAQLTTDAEREKVQEYLNYVASRSEIERQQVKEVTGVFTGSYAYNPFLEKNIPIWLGEYVLKDYGTGAIMAVPSDDDRDHKFATKFGLEIIDVIDKSKYPGATRSDKVGIMINSGYLDGMEVPDAIAFMHKKIEEMEIGSEKVNYRLRDAIYSRQRYWGEPIPILYDENGVAQTLEEADLPLELPSLENFKPAEDGRSPLARATDWVTLDGKTRETDTMPGFAGSSWYSIRFMDPRNTNALASPAAIKYWENVDLYVGGTEHAVGHLLYSRFWNKFLFDLEIVPTKEPYKKLINQGMIQGVIEHILLVKEKVDGKTKFICSKLAANYAEDSYTKFPVHVDFVADYGMDNSHLNQDGIRKFTDWRPEFKDAIFENETGTWTIDQETPFSIETDSEVGKMSKRYFNVVNPDDVVAKYGADCFRIYEMFLGPVEQSKPWDTKSIDGSSKFLRKVWSAFVDQEGKVVLVDEKPSPLQLKVLHTCIKRVTEDIERFSFNTCVSHFMICINDLRKDNCHNKTILDSYVRLLAPFAPFITEELWQILGNTESVHLADFPVFEAKHLVEDSYEYPISINGKKREVSSFAADASKEELEQQALALPGIQKWIEGKQVVKIIVVPKRMINIVVKG